MAVLDFMIALHAEGNYKWNHHTMGLEVAFVVGNTKIIKKWGLDNTKGK